MEILKLILNIVLSMIILVFGLGMITVGVCHIKNKVYPKWLSIVALVDGVMFISVAIGSWFV